MRNKANINGIKLGFKKDFNDGDLYQEWHDIYAGNDYLSKWAYHRMKVVLRRIDANGLGTKGKAFDIGVGSGVLMNELAKRGYDVWGSDFAMRMVQNCYEKLGLGNRESGNRLMVADLEFLPIKNESFDLVTCLGVLEYLPDEKSAIKELHRIVRPGGYSVIAVASYYRTSSIIASLKRRLFRKKTVKANPPSSDLSVQDHVRYFSPLDLRKKVVEGGFIVEKLECFGEKVFGRYFPMRIYIPGLFYFGHHCLLVLRKPADVTGF